MESLQESVFNSKVERRFLRWYRKIFSIEEIEQHTVLKWAFGAAVLSHYIAFEAWFYKSATTVDAYLEGTYRCWPYFQSCGEWLFLRALPLGYSQAFLYMVLFGTLTLSVYLMYKREWVLAHIALLPSFIWHTLGTFVITSFFSANYEYYLAILTLILLFLPHKEFFLKLTLVLFYFFAGALKIHEGWVLGTYFSAMKTGLPIFPDWSIPIWTNLVIFMEIIGAWFLLSKHWVLQRTTLIFFILFHLYSGLLVGFRYPTTVLPSVIIFFGLFYRQTSIPFDLRAVAGWTLVALMAFGQSYSYIIPGDEKLTLEGNKYGLYMFEANHQCISTLNTFNVAGEPIETRSESSLANVRCDPYKFWFALQHHCKQFADRSPEVGWTFDHSINGGPFYRIVDEKDACSLEYKPFSRNEWIKTEHDEPEVVGYPVENLY